MKAKFIIFFILILLIGGTGFYFGWVQIRMEENTYGVVFTKTGGYDEEVAVPGTFLWRWEALIPTNFTLHTFPVTPRTHNIEKSGILPSGDIYGNVLEQPADFSYRLEAEITYSLVPDFLPTLVQEEGLTSESLTDWYSRTDEEISVYVTDMIQQKIQSFDASEYDQFLLAPFREELLSGLNDLHDSFQIKNISILALELPDITLYRAARDYYLTLLKTRQNTEQLTLEQERSWVVSEESKLAVFKKYGELFTEYPGLIQFLSLREKGDLETLLPQIDILRDYDETRAEPNE